MDTALAALFTSDPSLVRCELDRVRALLTLPGEYASVGAWNDGMVVQQRYGAGVPRDELWEVPDTEVVVLASGTLPVGAQLELGGQPFRFHDWFFGQAGVVPRGAEVRERLFDQLPEFLQTTVRGESLAEVIFAHFLAELRQLGRIDDPKLEPRTAATLLQRVGKTVDHTASEAGASTKPTVALVASNGHVVAATRRGARRLCYLLLEGQVECRRHELPPNAPEKSAVVRDHRRRQSAVVSTEPLGAHAADLPDGAALAIGARGGRLALDVLPA